MEEGQQNRRGYGLEDNYSSADNSIDILLIQGTLERKRILDEQKSNITQATVNNISQRMKGANNT